MLNAFLKAGGLEVFTTIENAKGRSKTETTERKANQFAIDGVYRFGKSENFFVGAKYNTVKSDLVGYTSPVKIDRTAFCAGWFLTDNILMKGEIVKQQYKDFLATDYRNGGKFNGFVIEAIVGF